MLIYKNDRERLIKELEYMNEFNYQKNGLNTKEKNELTPLQNLEYETKAFKKSQNSSQPTHLTFN
jgi:hypothetical protein